MSSASSVSIIVSEGYRLLLTFFSVKPFSYIRSIDVRSALSRQIINNRMLMYLFVELWQ